MLTVSQENAIETARDYLDYGAFSKSGLIGQLKFEGFSAADARFAVNYISVNWNEQAAKSTMGPGVRFVQLARASLTSWSSKGFTHDQAVYGVNTTGL